MDELFHNALLLLGIDPDAGVDPATERQKAQAHLRLPLSTSVVELVRFPRVMPALAHAEEGSAMFPVRTELNDGSYMPDIEGPVLWLLFENQGVVGWGVPLDQGDDPPGLVGYQTRDNHPTVAYARTISEFVYAKAWDGRLYRQTPRLEAHLEELDAHVMAALRSRYREVIQTHGWPGDEQYRFEAEGGLKVSVADAGTIIDWYVSAADTDTLSRETDWLMTLSDLRRSFWSHDDEGERLLARLRSKSSSTREMFRHVPFPFRDGRFPPHLGAVVQKTVLEGQEPAREVVHTDDNSWLMGDGVHDPNLPGASIATHIRHVVDADPTLEELASLPLNHIAKRAGPDQPWQITRYAWLDEPSAGA